MGVQVGKDLIGWSLHSPASFLFFQCTTLDCKALKTITSIALVLVKIGMYNYLQLFIFSFGQK